MEAIKYLIGFFFKLALGAMFIAVVWWLVALLFPALSFTQVQQLVNSNQKKDLLPSPRLFAKNFKPAPVPYASSSVAVYGTKFNGYNSIDNGTVTWGSNPKWGPAELVTYSAGGNAGVNNNNQPVQQAQQESAAFSRSLYVRNLSIYEGGNISSNLTFIGEARNEMYKNGTFSVLIVNQQGNILGVSSARATGAWSIPGWSRFEVVISHSLPSGGVPCAVIFEQVRVPGDTQQPLRAGVPVRCN